MSSSTLTRRDPSATPGAFAGRLLVLEPVAAADLEPVVLAPGRYHVGSDEDCDVRLTVPGVAPRHCLIVVGPHRSVVKSLAPLTWLNDGVFREAALRPGDRLVAGPIEWTVGGVSSSEETVWKSTGATDPVKVLCDDAASRIELSQAALDARREWEQHRRVDVPVHMPAPAPQPTPSSVAINEQRAHLTELASSLAAREQEVIARETDVRCHWEDVQKNWAAVRELDRLVRSERAAVAAERADLLAERQAISAVRRELDEARADLGRRALDLTERESALHLRADDLVESHTLLSTRTAELQRREAEFVEREERLRLAETRVAERERELEQRRQEVDRQNAELAEREQRLSQNESARADSERDLAQRAEGLEHLQAGLVERESLLSQREQSFHEREHELEQRRHEIERRQAQLAEHEQQQPQHESARTDCDRGLEQRAAELERWQAANEERESQLAQREQSIEEREQAVNQRELRLAERDAELASRGQSISQSDEQLAVREQELAGREDQIARREQEYTGREHDLGRRDQELARRGEQVGHREQELAQLDDQIAQREQELARRVDEVVRREQELADRSQACSEQEAALARRADEVAVREAESQRREHELAEQQQRLDEQRASLHNAVAHAAATEGPADREAEIATLRQALEDRQRQLDDTAAQLRADRDALQLAQRELEARWGGIELEQAAVNDRRSELERDLAGFATARDELAQLRSSHEADEAIWDKRRGLLDAREQELEARAAQLDRAAADLAARSHDQPLSPQQTLLLGGPIAELLNRPGSSDWHDAAPAINQAASKDLLDERIALDEMRAKIEAERDELASLRAEWDAKVAVDIQRRSELDGERSLLSEQWDELRTARAEYERELDVFSEQRHELRRQLREFAIAQGAPEDLVIVDEGLALETTAPVPSTEQSEAIAPAEPVELAVPDEPFFAASVAEAPSPVFEIEAAPAGEPAGGSSPTLDGFSGFGSEVMPESFAEPPTNDACATMEIDCVKFVDEFGSERLFADRSATLPAAMDGGFGSPDWRPEGNRGGQDFISSTGVYDAGAALAEDRSDETIAWPPHGLLGEAQELERELEEPAPEKQHKEHDSVLALRARLAEMFGLSGSTVRVNEAPPKIPIRNVIDTVDASRHNLDAEREQAFAAAPEAPEPVESLPQPSAPQHDSTPKHFAELQQHNIPTPPPHGSNTEESIAAYMQQLLARSKAKLEVPADLLAEAATSDSRTRLATPIFSEPSSSPPPPPKTIAPEDKEAIRANLDSFRELANISARSAVAKHQSTKLQTVVQIKFIVLGIAMGLTLLLWIAGWFNSGSYLPYTTAAAIASIVMLADVVRTTLAISRLKSMEAAGEYEAETIAGQRSGVNLTPPSDSSGT